VNSNHPDISEILAAKSARRLKLAALLWEEKIAIVEQMQKSLPKKKWKQTAK
jgi:hypothetical protein